MAIIDFKNDIPLYSEFINELYELSLHCFRIALGFFLGASFINFQSFIDWLLVITLMDFIFTKIVMKILQYIMPKSMQESILLKMISQSISLGIIAIILQQNLFFLLSSRVLYFTFCFFSYLFSKSILESIAIAFYLNSAWFLVPAAINLLISVFYLIDRFVDIDFFNSLLELSIIQGILNELGIQTDMFLNYRIKMTPHESSYYHLVLKDNDLINQLRIYFLNSTSRNTLKTHLLHLKKTFADDYQKHPAQYVSANGEIISLPLTWDELSNVLKKYSEAHREKILQAYYQHDVHTLWRALQFNNPWLSKDIDSTKYHENFHESHYQEIFLYSYLQAKQANTISQWMTEMTTLYRKRNHEELKTSIFAKPTDNLKADMPDSIEYFQNFILQQLDKFEQIQCLTENKITQHWHQAIFEYWKNMLQKIELDNHFFELRFLWKEISHGRKKIQHTVFKNMNLDLDFKKKFLKQMKQHYQKKWLAHHTDFVEQLYRLNPGYVCHVEKYSLIFANLMDHYFKKEFSLKSIPSQNIFMPL